MTEITASQVAKYFLALESEDCGDTISNLKLQKLLYYAQGYHLALTDKPLFSEKIRAWEHGPVVREVYDEYRQHNADAIPKPTDLDLDLFSKETREILDEVYEVVGQFSAWKLRNMTHEEPPWRDTRRNGIIKHAAMKEYFKTLVR